MTKEKEFSRRSFFQFAIAGTFLVPALVNAATKCPATAPAGKMIAEPGVGMAKTLQYVADAKTTKHAKFKAGSDCGNCKFFNLAKADSGFAPCTMMGMKYVSECGWCMSYALKA